MSQRQHDEKDEKEEEKEEKEGEKGEKQWDEKWRRDPVSAVVWAAILIWAGWVLLAANMGFLLRFERIDAWAIIFIGAGLIVLAEAAFRLLVPSYRRGVTGNVILGLILLAVGLGNLVSWNIIGPLIRIILGGSILVRALLRRR